MEMKKNEINNFVTVSETQTCNAAIKPELDCLHCLEEASGTVEQCSKKLKLNIPKDSCDRTFLSKSIDESRTQLKVKRIICDQFGQELHCKEQEINLTDKRLHEAKTMIDKLRACLVVQYYTQTRLNELQKKGSVPLHPCVKKHVSMLPHQSSSVYSRGRASSLSSSTSAEVGASESNCSSNEKNDFKEVPLNEGTSRINSGMGSNFPVEKLEQDDECDELLVLSPSPGSINENEDSLPNFENCLAKSENYGNMDISSQCPEKLTRQRKKGQHKKSWYGKPDASKIIDRVKQIAPSRTVAELEETRSSRFKIKKRIVIGNVSKYIPLNQREQNSHVTHKWMLYLRGPRSDPDITSFVKEIFVFLHSSYKPNDLVKMTKSPFHLTRYGWGEFPIRIQLFFKDPRNKRVDVVHNLKLDKTYSGLQTLGGETWIDIELDGEETSNESVSNFNISANGDSLNDNTTVSTLHSDNRKKDIPFKDSSEISFWCGGNKNNLKEKTRKDKPTMSDDEEEIDVVHINECKPLLNRKKLSPEKQLVFNNLANDNNSTVEGCLNDTNEKCFSSDSTIKIEQTDELSQQGECMHHPREDLNQSSINSDECKLEKTSAVCYNNSKLTEHNMCSEDEKSLIVKRTHSASKLHLPPTTASSTSSNLHIEPHSMENCVLLQIPPGLKIVQVGSRPNSYACSLKNVVSHSVSPHCKRKLELEVASLQPSLTCNSFIPKSVGTSSAHDSNNMFTDSCIDDVAAEVTVSSENQFGSKTLLLNTPGTSTNSTCNKIEQLPNQPSPIDMRKSANVIDKCIKIRSAPKSVLKRKCLPLLQVVKTQKPLQTNCRLDDSPTNKSQFHSDNQLCIPSDTRESPKGALASVLTNNKRASNNIKSSEKATYPAFLNLVKANFKSNVEPDQPASSMSNLMSGCKTDAVDDVQVSVQGAMPHLLPSCDFILCKDKEGRNQWVPKAAIFVTLPAKENSDVS